MSVTGSEPVATATTAPVHHASADTAAPPGYFDDRSLIRRVLRERATALSGARALLMQAAHPLAVAGLLAHSDSLEDPYPRLGRTAEVMNAITFGTRAEADRLTRRVRRRLRQRRREAQRNTQTGYPSNRRSPRREQRYLRL